MFSEKSLSGTGWPAGYRERNSSPMLPSLDPASMKTSQSQPSLNPTWPSLTNRGPGFLSLTLGCRAPPEGIWLCLSCPGSHRKAAPHRTRAKGLASQVRCHPTWRPGLPWLFQRWRQASVRNRATDVHTHQTHMCKATQLTPSAPYPALPTLCLDLVLQRSGGLWGLLNQTGQDLLGTPAQQPSAWDPDSSHTATPT